MTDPARRALRRLPAAAQEEKAAAAAAAAEAERLTERQRIAEEKYAEADVDGDESVSKDELATLIQQMLVEQGIELDPEVVKQFVIEQFEEADADDDGTVSFEEFCVYYNSLIDRLEGEQRSAVMRGLREREAEVSAERMRQDAAQLAADDLADMEALMKLIAVLTDESVAPVSGTQLLFERGEAGVRPVASPSEEAYHTTRGIVLDLNQYGQRLITPWGSYIISYTLTFEGYNEESARAAAEEAALLRMNTESFYFVLCRISSPLLHFKKLPERTHFALTSVLNTAVAVGEVVDDAAAQRDEAWHAERVARFEAARDAAALPEPPPGKFLVNAVLGRTVVVDKSLIEPLESRLKKSKTKQRPEVVETALLLTGNDLEAAHKLRSEHLKDVDKLVSARKGYSTRDHCDEVLASCRWDYERALFVLENEAIAEATVNEIMKKRGLETGLGFPSRDEVKWEVALAKNEQASAIRSIVRQWTIEVRMMREIVKYAPVDRLAQRDAELEHPGRKHIEQLLERHGGDADYVEHLLSDTAFILKERKSLGNPSRERVEELVRHFDFDEHKVKAYLKSVEYIYKSRRQVGSPSRAEIEHYLDKFKYDQKKAIKYMKFVFKFIDPKQPRELAAAPRKIEGRLITHIAHNCELLLKGTPQPWARHSVEVALDATDSVEDEAIAFLIKVAKMHKDCPHLPRWELEYASARSYVLDRDDGKVTLDETMKQWKRFDQYVSSLRDVGAPDRLRVRDMLETLDFDEEATRARFAAIHEVSKTNDKAELGLGKDEIEKNLAKCARREPREPREPRAPRARARWPRGRARPPRRGRPAGRRRGQRLPASPRALTRRARAAPRRYDWDPEPTKKYLLGMHSLRSRAAQCGNPPLSTIEAALRRHELDAEMAYRHLWAVGQVKSDKEFLADASQPSAADIDRAMALVSYDVDKARVREPARSSRAAAPTTLAPPRARRAQRGAACARACARDA